MDKVDGAALAAQLDAEIRTPLLAIDEMLGGAKMLTRLAMRISPAEMDRDPVFAFNPKLPPVSNIHGVEMRFVCMDGELPVDAARITMPDLDRSYIVSTGGDVFGFGGGVTIQVPLDARFVKAPAALRVELLDETGDPVPIPQAQVDLVDSLIAGAQVGKASLPAGTTILPTSATRWDPPPSDADVTLASALDDVQADPGGCGLTRPFDRRLAVLCLLLLAVCLVVGRRRANPR